MTTKENWRVYKHTNLTNGKVYIGITSKKPEARWEYGNGYRHNAHMQNAIDKYGWDGFKHEVLHEGLTKEQASELEKQLISEYKSADRRYGYNIELGGYGRGAISDETREKMRQNFLGEKNPNYGKHLSAETKQKLSECNRGEKHPKYGKHHSVETRRRISEAVSGERNHMYGKKHTEEFKELMRTKNVKPVICVETGVVYLSAREASRQTGVNISGICIVCNGGRLHTAGGYHWKYAEEVTA